MLVRSVRTRQQEPDAVGGFRIAGGLSRHVRRLATARRTTVRRIASLFAAALAAIACATAPSGASAAPVYSYFPTGVTNDGKMLCVAGDGLSTLSGTTVTLSFSVDNTLSTFNLGFFDGASSSLWDMYTPTFPTSYTLYADPLGNGTGTTVVATWTDTQMAENAWTDFPVATSAAARAPSGNYFYRLVVNGTSPTVNSMNVFKARVEGYTYIIPTTVFGYIGAFPSTQSLVYPAWPTLTPTTYDGTWDFYMQVAQEADHIDLWDGDFDLINDTNDANTTYTPTFDPGAAITEAANAGAPADDNTNANYRRTPNVRYSVIDPLGNTWANNDPSGTTEWELFRLDTVATSTAVTDYHVDSLPSGMYDVRAVGVDMHNLNALRFEHPIIGVDESGRPMPPPAPFTVGDTVFNDLNGNGVQDAGENGIAGVLLSLTDTVTGRVIAAAMTDSSGAYGVNTWNGTYRVVVDSANFNAGGALFGFAPTTPSPAQALVTVTNTNVNTVDFGFKVPPALGLILSPDRAGSVAASQTISYTYTIANNNAQPNTVNLTAVSGHGWQTTLKNAVGSTVTSVSLGAMESTTVVVSVTVPAGTAAGTQDTMVLTGSLLASPSTTDSARGVTTVVGSDLKIAPNEASFAAPGGSAAYVHTITNSSATTRTVTLSASTSRGWTTAFYDTDGVTPLTNVVMGPFGTTRDVVVKVTVPSGTASGTVDVMTVTASSGGSTSSATDTTTVRSVVTYPDSKYEAAETTFTRGATVYAKATALATNRQYYFVWTSPSGATIRTGATSAPNSSGVKTDTYTTTATDELGTWTLRVYRSNGALTYTTTFVLVAEKTAEIAALWATDAATIGQNVSVSSSLHNSSPISIINSTATYVIWWDTNGDGVFGSLDTYIDASGNPQTWNGVSAVQTHTSTGVDVAGTSYWADPAWSISNSAFPNQGTYNVTEYWKASDGSLIDTKTTQFYSVPTLGAWMQDIAATGPRSLPWILAAGALWLALTLYLRSRRKWLRMYLLGAFGFVMFVLFFSQALGWDAKLEAIEARQAAAIAQWLTLHIELLGSSGLAIKNHVGWGVFDIGVECSALLEIAAFVGLTLFYPAFRSGRRLGTAAVGAAATYAINLARILIIIAMISALGTSWVFIAHAVVGRVFFFTGIVVVFWYLMTRPTVAVVSAKIDPSAEKDVRHG